MKVNVSGLDENGKQIFKIDKKEIALYEKAERELNQRYAFCNKNGHNKTNKSENICNYCYRRLEYYNPTKQIMNQRKKLPWNRKSYDAPILDNLRKESKDDQEMRDYSNGIRILKEKIRNNKKGLLGRLSH